MRKKAKGYKYFVSYKYTNSEGGGYGMSEAILTFPICSYSDITMLKDIIIKDEKMLEVVILNYKLLTVL